MPDSASSTPSPVRDAAAGLSPQIRDGYLEIGAHAAIGDGRTLALVGTDGSIDWMCLPNLDSPSVFGALLSPREGGRFELAPDVPYTVTRRYIERTNVLQTTFETDAGRVRVTDALTLDSSITAPWRELARHVEGLSGSVPMRWRCDPRFEFGHVSPEWIGRPGGVVARHQRLQIGVCSWDAGADDTGRAGRFRAGEGDSALIVMTGASGGALPLPDRDAVQRRLEETERVWRDWVSRQTYRGPWQDEVERSLLAIRLLADGREGALTAAGTTSLPEVIGGKRNFDYRFGWVRDASFTLDALMSVGMEQLTHAVVQWLLRSVANTRPRVDPVYALDGSVVRSQHSIPLPGYRHTEPVHVGNQAGSQLQLGGWGDLMETVWRYVRTGHVLDVETGQRLADACDLLCRIWTNQDAGLWEISDAQYGTSKLSCWTALDRALDLASTGDIPARHTERWRRERDAMRRFIEDRLWSEEQGSYLQKVGSEALDCGMLLAVRRGYCDADDPRIARTIDAIRRELTADGPLLYRYSGMQDEENAFIACSYWLVEALALTGRREEGAELMGQLSSISNDVGLLSEEIVPGDRRLRGNLPQALSHLALINAAVALGSGD